MVHQQPSTDEEIMKARSALAACPVAAIRLETLAEWRHRASSAEEKQQVETGWSDESEQLVQKMQLRSGSEAPFPRQFLDDEKLHDIYWLGHHNDRSFGATPYLLRSSTSEGTEIWIMVNSPKFSSSAVKDVEGLTGPGGPDYLFLSHVDDTADHNKWAQYWQENGHGNLKRILHSAELRNNWVGDTTLEEVEILLAERESTDGSTAYKLSGEVLPSNWQESTSEPVVVLHTPGHSQGSITLYRRPSNSEPGILFTGDTYGWTPRGGGKMTGFPRYGDDLRTQARSLQYLQQLDWEIIAPGHGHPRDYRQVVNASVDAKTVREKQEEELQIALGDMVSKRY